MQIVALACMKERGCHVFVAGVASSCLGSNPMRNITKFEAGRSNYAEKSCSMNDAMCSQQASMNSCKIIRRCFFSRGRSNCQAEFGSGMPISSTSSYLQGDIFLTSVISQWPCRCPNTICHIPPLAIMTMPRKRRELLATSIAVVI